MYVLFQSTSSIKCSEDEANEELYKPTIKTIYLGNIVKNISENLVFEIRNRFFEESPSGSVSDKQLKAILKPYNLDLSEKNFQPMFAKMDQRKEGAVNFSQFVVYLSAEFESYRRQFGFHDETSGNAVFIIETPLKVVNKHRRPIIGIQLKPLLGQDAVQNEYIDGEYVTASNDGVVNFWTLDMKWKRDEIAPARNVTYVFYFRIVKLSIPDNKVQSFNCPDFFQLIDSFVLNCNRLLIITNRIPVD